MDITKKGWKCDICEEEFFEQDCGYKAKYSIETGSYEAVNNDSNNEYSEVCFKCIKTIEDVISKLLKDN